jgi:SulP family sulfate permease
VLALTAITGLAFGLDEAILAGVGVSILLFVPRAAKLKANELVVDDEGVVRERLPDDPPCSAFILEDLEGELFFGAAPELERSLTALTNRAQAEKINHIVLRVKRVRDPDVVCLEQFQHFLGHADALGITVLLAGARPDLLDAFHRLRFGEWFPDDRIFPQGGDEDSATLAAIRSVYERLGDANPCEHCGPRKSVRAGRKKLYYLV